ncbi:hypothetical protein A3Q34_10800 [Colwellia sp. PAMC 20917]|uniref:hypothetical protein n=1 Tax=Colwellia sp. PAMC 20917 TaxID=1816218 RepID=UPI000878938A|nr:hypothetical protein [Colwellia sp. PAMC 20917]AOW77302.1 hypothetical protein A3Q34_10800 [Colwellia sp. PAMC 20917]
MIFVLSIAAIFVALSIYFYFRAEGLQRALFSVKKEFSSSQKENKFYIDSMAIIAKRHEDFVKNRLQIIKNCQALEPETIEIISPLINNYAAIFIECLKGKGKLQSITKKCYENFDDDAFRRFVAHIAKQDASVRRMWSSNNLTGYISLIEALLLTKTQKDA